MITESIAERVRGWFHGRLPREWQEEAPPDVVVDREEITVRIHLAVPETPRDVSAAEAAETRAGAAQGFREDTREQRITIARDAEHRFRRKVAWGVVVGEHEELFTNLAVPVMTRLRQPQRQVLDTLVDAGVARSRADALGWCVRLVGEHTEEWLGQLREAMTRVEEVRRRGPAA